MKKLLCSAAVCGLALAAYTPAHAADGVKLDLGGWFKGYGAWVDQDVEEDDEDVNALDIVRHTEVHFGGETTLENGLTVGAHIEAETDGAGAEDDSFEVEESYVYFSNTMGRLNFGAEDGAAYLLQVEAPSADDNVDGLRQYVQAVNYSALTGAADPLGPATFTGEVAVDYDNNVTGFADKLTYLSPLFNGFQFGLSYSPDSDNADDFEGVGFDDVEDTFGQAWEAAFRYEGMFNNIGLILGAGYVTQELEEETAGGPDAGDPSDDREAWDAGVDLDVGPFGVGVAYVTDNHGDVDTVANAAEATIDEEEVWVFGVDYTTGPFKIGASYYDSDNSFGVAELETQRWTGGVVYTYGPGMTFRGSVSHIEHDNTDEAAADGGLALTEDEAEATVFLFGTQINF